MAAFVTDCTLIPFALKGRYPKLDSGFGSR